MAWCAAIAAEAGESGGNMEENGPAPPGVPVSGAAPGATPVKPGRPGKRAEKIAITPIVPHLILLPRCDLLPPLSREPFLPSESEKSIFGFPLPRNTVKSDSANNNGLEIGGA